MNTARNWSVTQLSNEALDREYAARVENDRASTAELLLYLGEMESRRRYVPAGYPSIGRLTISALVLLAPELTEHTAARLLAAIAPKPDVPTKEREVPFHSASTAARNENRDVSTSSAELAVRPVAPSGSSESAESMGPLWASGAAGDAQADSEATRAPAARPNVERQAPRASRTQHTPLSPTSMHVSATLSMQVYEQLQEARELLSHRLASRELSEVLEALLGIALPVLRKQKFAEASRPRAARSKVHSRDGGKSEASPAQARQIPAHVKREVWERDGGRCTFVGTDGHRCTCRERIEFDHRIPVAKGGESTFDNVRLLCHAHNQYEAERVLGAKFMRGKRAWAARRGGASSRTGAPHAPASRTCTPRP
ncbi:MAG: HNH endonuclease [Candidatus Eisenbacteria bacterium]|uniref:HNH endonuclease n=1 Tax=Eiseniibacteriota bacterium TaxID=2212470 RepID=A0A933SGR0_UNCEI|nr:HNH endonuclease [Candidatus Eisenbacteria bacterium]